MPTFVAKRSPEWTRLEALLAKKHSGALQLDELQVLDRLYRKAAADLAQAQTFYAGTDVVRFLNQLTAQAYGAIYRRPLAPLTALRRFYGVTFPSLARANLRFIGVAGGLMALGALLGAVTVGLDDNGARLLVPDNLRDFIARKQLWTDKALDQHPPSEMATQIFTNNLRVTILAFAGGITAAALTALVMFGNGLQLGAVMTHCFQRGVGFGLLDFTLAHGPVELSVIAICGGAGFMVGDALITPTERPRAEVLRERARDGVQLVLGCAPFLVGIGLMEGFVSPGSLFPTAVKAVLGASLGLGFWSYLLRLGR